MKKVIATIVLMLSPAHVQTAHEEKSHIVLPSPNY
jgi:hypothetical protein